MTNLQWIDLVLGVMFAIGALAFAGMLALGLNELLDWLDDR